MTHGYPKDYGLPELPELDFSCITGEGTDEEYAELERLIARCSSHEHQLARIAYWRAHPERRVSWDMPYTMDEYERMVLAGEFD